jgi:membrane fusion protein, multidrug efflux system
MPSTSRFQQLRSSRFFSLFVVLVCLAVLGGCAWYLVHRNAANAQANGNGFGFGRGGRRPTATVAFATATLADIPIRMEALGTVTPIAAATVRAQVAGVLTQIHYTEGQVVKRGQPLVQIDPRPFQLALDQAIAQAQRDQAQLENARVILERNRTLLAQDSIAQQDVDTQEATVKQLQGTVEADRAAVATARLNLDYSNVDAPISGRVGLRPVDIGNYVTSGDTNGVASITQLSPIDVVFTLPADSVTTIQQQVHSGETLPTTVLDRTRTRVLGNGTFLTLDNQIDTQTGTVRAKARFENADGVLFPNEFVNVQLQVDTLKQAVVVPTNAIRHGPQGDFVFVIDQDNAAHITLVKVGPSFEDRVSIAQGLKAGERVVTEGGDRLTDGSVVHLPGDQVGAPGARQGQGKMQWSGKRDGAGANGGGKRRRPAE